MLLTIARVLSDVCTEMGDLGAIISQIWSAPCWSVGWIWSISAYSVKVINVVLFWDVCYRLIGVVRILARYLAV